MLDVSIVLLNAELGFAVLDIEARSPDSMLGSQLTRQAVGAKLGVSHPALQTVKSSLDLQLAGHGSDPHPRYLLILSLLLL